MKELKQCLDCFSHLQTAAISPSTQKLQEARQCTCSDEDGLWAGVQHIAQFCHLNTLHKLKS